MKRLENKVAVITGATGGIGRVACEQFCEEGASVIGVDIAEGAGRELETELKGKGFNFEFIRCDVSATDDVKAVAKRTLEKFGHLDILYNNAGVILGKPFLETTDEEWDFVQNVNLKSVFLMMRECTPLMKGRKGSIINVSSIGGVVAFQNLSAYGAAKAGVVLLSKAAAVDLAPDIRVNAICPGVINTPMPRNFVSKFPEKDAILKAFADGHLVKRLGTPEEIVSLVIYLGSDESSFMTGAAINIDGGWSVQ